MHVDLIPNPCKLYLALFEVGSWEPVCTINMPSEEEERVENFNLEALVLGVCSYHFLGSTNESIA